MLKIIMFSLIAISCFCLVYFIIKISGRMRSTGSSSAGFSQSMHVADLTRGLKSKDQKAWAFFKLIMSFTCFVVFTFLSVAVGLLMSGDIKGAVIIFSVIGLFIMCIVYQVLKYGNKRST